jgi:hypothetical protein
MLAGTVPRFSNATNLSFRLRRWGGIDRKQCRSEFQGLKRNAKQQQGIEEEQRGTLRTLLAPQWPLVFEWLESMVAEFFVKRHGRLRTKIRGAGGRATTKTFKKRELSLFHPGGGLIAKKFDQTTATLSSGFRMLAGFTSGSLLKRNKSWVTAAESSSVDLCSAG